MFWATNEGLKQPSPLPEPIASTTRKQSQLESQIKRNTCGFRQRLRRFFVATFGERLRLAFCPLQAQTAGDRDAVDKYRFVLVEAGRVAEALQSIRDRYVYSNFCCEVVGSLASTVYSETDAHWSDQCP